MVTDEGHVDIVALTATPPVDVPQAEWNRYSTFCGPIDEEVGVPELVAEGNLCPHQDFVHFSLPTRDRSPNELHRFQRGVQQAHARPATGHGIRHRDLSAFPRLDAK